MSCSVRGWRGTRAFIESPSFLSPFQIIIPLISLLAAAVACYTFAVLLVRFGAICSRHVRLFLLTLNNPHLDVPELNILMAAGCGGAAYSDVVLLAVVQDALDTRAYTILLEVILPDKDASLIDGEADNHSPPLPPLQEQPQPQPLEEPEEVELAEATKKVEEKQPKPQEPQPEEVEAAGATKQAGAEGMV